MKALGVEGTLASDFLNTLEALQEACAPLVMDFALAVEERYGVHGLSCDVADTKQEWVFRFLHYRGGTATLAHPHIDRGGFTLHLAESRQGAQYLDLNKRWQSLVVDGGRTAIFPSLGLQYCSEGTLKALCHQVQGDVERYAAVAFIDFMKVFAYNQDNGRLQDFEPGFNYDMPFGEFQKLFVTT
jgi:isopenicillin N synthase-like dioxygenase